MEVYGVYVEVYADGGARGIRVYAYGWYAGYTQEKVHGYTQGEVQVAHGVYAGGGIRVSAKLPEVNDWN